MLPPPDERRTGAFGFVPHTRGDTSPNNKPQAFLLAAYYISLNAPNESAGSFFRALVISERIRKEMTRWRRGRRDGAIQQGDKGERRLCFSPYSAGYPSRRTPCRTERPARE